VDMGSSQWAPHDGQLCLKHCVICWVVFSVLCFVSTTAIGKSRVKVNVLNWSDQVQIWDMSKGSISLVGIGQWTMNEALLY
jgi:hypothetical protein